MHRRVYQCGAERERVDQKSVWWGQCVKYYEREREKRRERMFGLVLCLLDIFDTMTKFAKVDCTEKWTCNSYDKNCAFD